MWIMRFGYVTYIQTIINTPTQLFFTHGHHVSWSFTNFARILSASEELMRSPLAFFLGSGLATELPGRRSPASCSATILCTLGVSSKVNALRVVSFDADSADPPLGFFDFTCSSAFRKAFASGLLCLRAGSGVLPLSLLSGAIVALYREAKAE